MAISSANTFPYKYLEESKYKFNPSQAFTSVPELNIAEKIPFSMTGVDLTTGKRVDLAAPKKEKDRFKYSESAVPMGILESDLAALDALANKNLQRSLLGYQMQQQADLAALPEYAKLVYDTAEKTRKLDYNLGLSADIFSPTKQQQRMQSAQAGEASMAQAFGYQTGNAANLAAATAPRKYGR